MSKPLPASPNNWRLGLGYALTTAVFWGLLPLALKGLLQDMDVWTITWYRFAVSALIGMVWYGHRSGGAMKRMLLPQHRWLTAAAVLGLLGNYGGYIVGLEHTTASASQIMIQLAPLTLLIGSVVLFKEPFSPVQWLGVAGFTAGMLLFFNQRLVGLVPTDSQYIAGMGWLIAAALVWTVYGLAQKKLLSHFLPRDILLLIYIAGTLVFLPLAHPAVVFQLDVWQWLLLAFVALNTTIAYGAFAAAMVVWESSRVSAIITLAPLLTLLFSQLMLLLRPELLDLEPLNLLSWTGALLVIGGSSVAALAGNRKARVG